MHFCSAFQAARFFDVSRFRNPAFRGAVLALAAALGFLASPLHAAQVQHLGTQSATASGAGAGGKPTVASFAVPAGKNRVLFLWATFERDHCSPADGTGGLCTSGNTAGTGLGDNWPEPRIGTPPATTSNSQITAQVVGPGGTINRQNALVIGGTPSGDTRFITISTSPSGSPAGTSFFGLSSFHIVLYENDINTLLGGAVSGTVSVAFPDVSTPSNAGDEAIVIASVFQNVEQTVNGFVRNGTATAQVVTGTPGNFSLPVAAYDAGQLPDEADDGKLVMGANSSTEGFLLPAGHTALATLAVINANGTYDTPNGSINNEPNGLAGAAYFRNGGATPGSVYTLQAAGAAATLVYGGTSASFLLESDNADVGDAPAVYGNASHTISGIRLGATVDADASLLNNATATGDDTNNTDDEDGVTLTPLLPIGQTAVVPVSIQNGSGFLSAWFDWNADGDFNDAGEQMVTAQAVTVGTVNLNIAVPMGAVIGATFARFRVCTSNAALDNCNTPLGTVQSGEVEDYQFQVNRALLVSKVSLAGFGGPFDFTLSNTSQATGTVTTTAAATPTIVDGNTGMAGSQHFSVVAPNTAVTITESGLSSGWSITGASCVNAVGTTVGSRSGDSYTITGAEIAASVSFSCTFTNTKLPALRLQKVLPNGRAVAGDQFLLGIAGSGGPATVTTTGSGATATGVSTLAVGVVGATYTLSEAGAAGANLANYQSSWICTNALPGGQVPSGSGTTFDITAAAGDDLTCTFSNSRALTVTATKAASANPLVAGQSGQFYTVAINVANGPTTAPITVADALPNGITLSGAPTLIAGTTTGTLSGCPSSGGNTTGCSVAAGVATGSFSIRIPVTVAAAAIGTGGGSNSANLGGGGDPACTAAATGQACDPSTPATAVRALSSDLSIVKSNASSTYTPGGTGSYTLTVRNGGPDNATGVAVSDSLPAGISLNGAVTCVVTGGGSCGANTGTAPAISLLLDLNVGAAATITIPVLHANVP